MNQVSDRRARFVFPVLLAGLCLALLALAYLATVMVRGVALQNDMAVEGRGSIGKVYKADPVLGIVPAPGINGLELVPLGKPVALHHDGRGFRVAAGTTPHPAGRRPRVLFLGDSFTYGRMVAAEDTFAALTARRLGGEGLNAGVNGYGLAQMVLRARQMIPAYRPDIVVVQYSPWLVARAIDEFAPAETGKKDRLLYIPAPYYADGAPLQITGPAFDATPEEWLVPAARLAAARSGRWMFFWRFALPLTWHQDSRLAWFRLKQTVGLAPRPTTDEAAVIRDAYAELSALSSRYHARMLILALGSSAPLEVPGELFPPGVGGVNGWRALVEPLAPQTTDEYTRQYMIWRGSPPQLVDWHPNEHAHEVIAEALATRIRMGL